MTPEEALALIDANVAQLNGTREAHAQLQAAVMVLRLALGSAPETEEPLTEGG